MSQHCWLAIQLVCSVCIWTQKAATLWTTPNVNARCSTCTVRPPSAKLAVCCCSTYYGNIISMHAPIPNWRLPRFTACVKAHGHGSYMYVCTHVLWSWMTKLGIKRCCNKLWHILRAIYTRCTSTFLFLASSPCISQRNIDCNSWTVHVSAPPTTAPRPLKRWWLPSGYETHQRTSTEKLVAAVRVWKPSEHEMTAMKMMSNVECEQWR